MQAGPGFICPTCHDDHQPPACKYEALHDAECHSCWWYRLTGNRTGRCIDEPTDRNGDAPIKRVELERTKRVSNLDGSTYESFRPKSQKEDNPEGVEHA